MNADLKYPIILDKNNTIIDGMHRLTKAYLLKKKHIKAYIFDDNIMKKFIIGTKKGKEWTEKDWDYYESLSENDIINLYKDRFSDKQIGGYQKYLKYKEKYLRLKSQRL